jgi:ATP synthase protein I
MRQGNRVLTELIAGPAGGALVGWLFDRLLGTSPALLLVCMFLGIAVAFRNIIKISGERPE